MYCVLTVELKKPIMYPTEFHKRTIKFHKKNYEE